jgi:hypothetical protein
MLSGLSPSSPAWPPAWRWAPFSPPAVRAAAAAARLPAAHRGDRQTPDPTLTAQPPPRTLGAQLPKPERAALPWAVSHCPVPSKLPEPLISPSHFLQASTSDTDRKIS